jgi:hypothetical protein
MARCRNIIRIAIKKRMTPPAMLTAGEEMPMADNKYCPKNKNKERIISAITISLMMIIFRFLGSISCNIDRKRGTLPNGSITRRSVIAAVNMVIIFNF